nr:hypothetical protein [uncultured Desulfobulbus sp.]
MIVQIFFKQRLFFGTIEYLPFKLWARQVIENEELQEGKEAEKAVLLLRANADAFNPQQ